MIQIIFNGIPPSINSAYCTNFKTGRRFPSKELADFKKEFARLKRPAQADIEVLKDKRLCLLIELWCAPSRVYTKKGTVKKWDISNCIKSLEDAASDMLGIDDSHFFRVVIEKKVTELPETTYITIMENRTCS